MARPMSPFNLKHTAFHMKHTYLLLLSIRWKKTHMYFFTNAFASCTGNVLAQACDAHDSSVLEGRKCRLEEEGKKKSVKWRKSKQESIAILTINVGM